MQNQSARRLVLGALFLALCMVLPFLTGQIPQVGSMLSPMHIPVLLCGYICGWQYGAAVGLIAPLLRGTLFGMPPPVPTGIAMSFELAVYGLMTGLLYRRLPRKRGYLYLSLVVAMLAGRAVWGIARLFLAGLSGTSFTYAMFLAGAFTNAVPGIAIQLVLIPLIIFALERANFLPGGRKNTPAESRSDHQAS